MAPQELKEWKTRILDDLHELASEPVADPEVVKATIEAFFIQLEEDTNGKKR